MIHDYPELTKAIARLVEEAGHKIMGFYKGERTDRLKGNSTPVTDADIAAHDHILAGLKTLTPNIPVVSEEDEQHNQDALQQFWLVDPLDGTKSFIRGTGEFTVNIALIANNLPVIGAIYAPLRKTNYWGGKGKGAFRQKKGGAVEPIQVRPLPAQGQDVIVSHAHISGKTKDYLETLKLHSSFPMASSLKFCIVAEGSADQYPRHGPTMEWDTAAGHAILEGAGGEVLLENGEPLTYGKVEFRNPHFIAYGSR